MQHFPAGMSSILLSIVRCPHPHQKTKKNPPKCSYIRLKYFHEMRFPNPPVFPPWLIMATQNVYVSNKIAHIYKYELRLFWNAFTMFTVQIWYSRIWSTHLAGNLTDLILTYLIDIITFPAIPSVTDRTFVTVIWAIFIICACNTIETRTG